MVNTLQTSTNIRSQSVSMDFPATDELFFQKKHAPVAEKGCLNSFQFFWQLILVSRFW